MTTKSILIGKFVDHAAPFLWGSVQDASGMTLVAEGLPFVVVNQPPYSWGFLQPFFGGGNEAEHHRVDGDGEQCACQDQRILILIQ